MKNYDTFAPYYDLAMGDQKQTADALRRLIRRHAPRAEKLLELGCGSGSLLKILSRTYRTWGIDLSRGMIELAKKKAPKSRLFVGDISKMSLNERFDVVICAFDTINHVPGFSRWRQVFRRAHGHLAPEGVFIFDINTEHKIERYHSESPYVEVGKTAVSVFDVTMKSATSYSLTVKVFKKAEGAMYALHEMLVKGSTYPVDQILKALEPYFEQVILVDLERAKPSRKSEELYFVCRKPRQR